MEQQKLIDELRRTLSEYAILIGSYEITLSTSIDLLKATGKHPCMIDWLEGKAKEYKNEIKKITNK